MFPEDGVTFEPLVRFAEAASLASTDEFEATQAAKDRARPLATARGNDVRTEPVAAAEPAGRHVLVRAVATGGPDDPLPTTESGMGSAIGWSPLWRKRQ